MEVEGAGDGGGGGAAPLLLLLLLLLLPLWMVLDAGSMVQLAKHGHSGFMDDLGFGFGPLSMYLSYLPSSRICRNLLFLRGRTVGFLHPFHGVPRPT